MAEIQKASESIVEAAVKAAGVIPSKRPKGAFAAELAAGMGLPDPAEVKRLEAEGLAAFKAHSGLGQVKLIPIGKLTPSPTNPRKTFVKLEELGASLIGTGFVQPLVVRPWVDPISGVASKERFEIVCGERRYRAAKLMEIAQVPCDVRELADSVVADLQVTENLQRAGLTPIEEAEGFDALIKRFHMTAEQVAQKHGTSASTVRGRCKLLALGPEGRAAVAEGWLPQSVGTVLARSCQTHALQAKWLKSQRREDHGDGIAVIEARWAIDHLQREFTHALKDAPFDVKDADLVPGDEKNPAPGSCFKCPKNAANGERGLFDDLGARPGQICTDTDCYAMKCAAAVKIKTAELEARGVEILKGKEAEEAFSYSSDLVKLTEKNYQDPKHRTWGEILSKLPETKAPDLVAAIKDGHVVELASKREITKAVAESSGAKWAKEEATSAAKRKKDKAKFKEEAEDRAKRSAVTAEISMAIARAAKSPDLELWRELALRVFSDAMLSAEQLKALGFELGPKGEEASDQLMASIEKKGTAEQLRAYLFAYSLMESDAAQDFEHREDLGPLRAVAKRFGVNVDQIVKAFEQAEAAEELMKGKKGKAK